MAVVLAIEPDLRQTAILKRIVKEKVKADLVVVDSRDAAMEAIRRGVPDVLLLSALMSPRDEDELIQHLRSLDGADHLQTHTIPQLSSSLEDHAPSKARGLLKAFRRKKEPEAPSAGCDPDLFADEIRTFVKYAAEKKEERRALIESGQLAADAAARNSAMAEQPSANAPGASSWDDPFAWNPSPSQAPVARESSSPEEHVPTTAIPEPGPLVIEATPEPVVTETPAEPDPSSMDNRPAEVMATPDSQLPTPKEIEVEVEEPVLAVAPAPSGSDLDLLHPIGESRSDPTPPDDVVSAAEDTQAPEAEALTQSAAPAIPGSAPPGRSLGPLATWVRFEVAPPKDTPRTTNDELRDLMAHLAIPTQVAGVTYARGCRIRRVRVKGGRERRKGDVPGPVILSRRQLAAQREADV